MMLMLMITFMILMEIITFLMLMQTMLTIAMLTMLIANSWSPGDYIVNQLSW